MRPRSFASPARTARTARTKRKRRRNEADLPVTGGGQAGLTPLNLRYAYIDTPTPPHPPHAGDVYICIYIYIYILYIGGLVRGVSPACPIPVTGRSASFRLRFRFVRRAVRAVRAGEAKLRGRM